MSVLSKNDLIEFISEEAELSKVAAARSVKAFTDFITQALGAKNKVSISGFGNFETKERQARTGRNPQTGETIEIQASFAPTFKAGKSLKDAVNEACNMLEEV